MDVHCLCCENLILTIIRRIVGGNFLASVFLLYLISILSWQQNQDLYGSNHNDTVWNIKISK